MERKEIVERLRRTSTAYKMWSGIADDGIVGPMTADVEHAAAMEFFESVREARKHGLRVGEIVSETGFPYSTVFLVAG